MRLSQQPKQQRQKENKKPKEIYFYFPAAPLFTSNYTVCVVVVLGLEQEREKQRQQTQDFFHKATNTRIYLRILILPTRTQHTHIRQGEEWWL